MLKEEKELRKLFKQGLDWPDDKYVRGVSKAITALVRAVREDCAKVDVPKYSGELSRPFWDLVNSFRSDDRVKDKLHSRLYKLGCNLQNLEGEVLDEIAAAIRGKK